MLNNDFTTKVHFGGRWWYNEDDGSMEVRACTWYLFMYDDVIPTILFLQKLTRSVGRVENKCVSHSVFYSIVIYNY